MASLKSVKCNAPQPMPNDGRAVWLTDKAILGAGQLGTPVAADTIDFKVPGGTKLCDLAFFLDDSDTGAAFVFGVGYRPVDSVQHAGPFEHLLRRGARPSAKRVGAWSARSSRSSSRRTCSSSWWWAPGLRVCRGTPRSTWSPAATPRVQK
jgi:hypothetical protein